MRIAGSKVLAQLSVDERKLALRATGASLKTLSEKDAAALSARARRAAKKHRDRVRGDVRDAQRHKGARGAAAADPMAEKKVALLEEVARRFDERRDADTLAPARREERRASPKPKSKSRSKSKSAAKSVAKSPVRRKPKVKPTVSARSQAEGKVKPRPSIKARTKAKSVNGLAAGMAPSSAEAQDVTLDLASASDQGALGSLLGAAPAVPPPSDEEESPLLTVVRRWTGDPKQSTKPRVTPPARDVGLDRRRLFGTSNLRRRHAHSAARGRRQQARRDRRN